MKNKRQEKILEILKLKPIFTQDDLQTALNEYGYNVTQSTVSRDIRELKLIKAHDSYGNYCYVAPEQNTGNTVSNYESIITNSVKSVSYAMNNVVLKCYSGMAQSVCVAVDGMFENKMLGSIAGDDTVLVITHGEEESKDLVFEINNLI